MFISFRVLVKNDTFLKLIANFKSVIAKVLSFVMMLIITFAIIDLLIFLVYDLVSHPIARFSLTLLEILALFLNILIGLEILKNIAVFVRQQTIQLKLVITTSLMAISRKLIIYDLEKLSGINMIGLAVAVFALSASHTIIRQVNPK
jgi:uncharacterized membrane protein (DUF373 family)